jgi:hypothetical protein
LSVAKYATMPRTTNKAMKSRCLSTKLLPIDDLTMNSAPAAQCWNRFGSLRNIVRRRSSWEVNDRESTAFRPFHDWQNLQSCRPFTASLDGTRSCLLRLERFRAKWLPVRVKKTHQDTKLELLF